MNISATRKRNYHFHKLFVTTEDYFFYILHDIMRQVLIPTIRKWSSHIDSIMSPFALVMFCSWSHGWLHNALWGPPILTRTREKVISNWIDIDFMLGRTHGLPSKRYILLDVAVYCPYGRYDKHTGLGIMSQWMSVFAKTCLYCELFNPQSSIWNTL